LGEKIEKLSEHGTTSTGLDEKVEQPSPTSDRFGGEARKAVRT
jgi:hypothetical protein